MANPCPMCMKPGRHWVPPRSGFAGYYDCVVTSRRQPMEQHVTVEDADLRTPAPYEENHVPDTKKNYKKDWEARKPYYIVKVGKQVIDDKVYDSYLLIINQRKLVTLHPIEDLISTLEEQLATLRDQLEKSCS